MSKENLAQHALNLRDNDAFQEALTTLRNEALEYLVEASPTDPSAIYTHQATVKVVDNLRAELAGMIRAGLPKTSPGIA